MISNIIGQGKINEIRRTLFRIMAISGIGISFFIAVINIWPSVFLGFYGLGEDFLAEAIGPLRVVTIAMLILGVGVILLNAVIATGKTIVVFWIEFAGIFSYLLYVFLVIEIWKMDHLTAWMSEWVYWSVMAFLSIVYLWKGKWKKSLSID
ncbi:MAG: hypothetical protein IPN97_14600 [Saprospiraceae bacterium]|nr:hypothetical protein [Saprospiraceae bacterium]